MNLYEFFRKSNVPKPEINNFLAAREKKFIKKWTANNFNEF